MPIVRNDPSFSPIDVHSIATQRINAQPGPGAFSNVLDAIGVAGSIGSGVFNASGNLRGSAITNTAIMSLGGGQGGGAPLASNFGQMGQMGVSNSADLPPGWQGGGAGAGAGAGGGLIDPNAMKSDLMGYLNLQMQFQKESQQFQVVSTHAKNQHDTVMVMIRNSKLN